MRVHCSILLLVAYAAAIAGAAVLPALVLDGPPAWAAGLAAGLAVGRLGRRPCGILVGRLVDVPTA
jgi:hypothetical protein